MKPKRNWRNKSKKHSHHSTKQDKQLRMTNMVLQVYADKKHTARRPLYSNTQYAGGVITGSVTAGGAAAGGPVQKRGSNQDIPFELSFNPIKQHHRSKSNSQNVKHRNNHNQTNNGNQTTALSPGRCNHNNMTGQDSATSS